MITKFSTCLLFLALLLNSCQQRNQPTSPQYEAEYNRSTTPALIDIEKALDHPAMLKLSQIASKLEYYNVGDARYTVTQAIAIPDSDAFITFNNPRIYYRKQGIPSKRYGFKALDYKWNHGMNGLNLFYDKKTTRMYCALSGLDQDNKKDSTTFNDIRPCIGELPTLDTMLTIQNYIFPENLPTKYSINADAKDINVSPDTITRFQTFYWNTDQDRINFLIPYRDTVYQLSSSHSITPLYALHKDNQDKPTGLRSFLENPNGLFMGVFQKGSPAIYNWLGWLDDYKPVITHRVVYLKKEKKTYALPKSSGGFINDIDDGLPFWPDGQTDDCVYMIRTVTEMRETVKRTGSSRQKDLIKFLDDPKVFERDYVMIVARP